LSAAWANRSLPWQQRHLVPTLDLSTDENWRPAKLFPE
jgi:hypothetical protein